ncbi:MAG TPA: RNA polymerase sigma factor [Tepidisphaeraceae bacterium]|nr:RNA polymerase sigma factor [Tepidisphaeraceae bacterium]
MELTSDVLDGARRGNRSAIVELLTMHYPIVWRMAVGLTGRQDVGRGVTKYLMQRSLRAMPRWKDEGAPLRWFHHHTLLSTRRTEKHSPQPGQDTLIQTGADAPAYVAFIHALRSLPMQQREAFLLCYGEKLETRAIAVAMDCSIVAAGNHLREATDRLRALGPEDFDAHSKLMGQTYQKLAPDEELSVQDVRQRVRRYLFPYFLRRTAGRLVSLVLFAAVLYGTYWVYQMVEHSLEK